MVQKSGVNTCLVLISFVYILSIALMLHPDTTQGSEYYGWTDNEGNVHITDQPPDPTVMKKGDHKAILINTETSSDAMQEKKVTEKTEVTVPEQKQSLSNVPTEEDTKKDPNIMQEYKKLRKRFDSRNSMTLDELSDLKNDLTILRDKIVSSEREDDFREEVNNIADMRFFTNDLIIIKSKNR